MTEDLKWRTSGLGITAVSNGASKTVRWRFSTHLMNFIL